MLPPPGMMPGMPPPMPAPYGGPPSHGFTSPEIETAKSKANTALILGVAGFLLSAFFIGVIPGIYGMIEAQRAIKIFDAHNHNRDRGKASGAIVLGVLSIIGFVLSLVARLKS